MQKKDVKSSVKVTETKVVEAVKEAAKGAEKKVEEVKKAVETVKKAEPVAAKDEVVKKEETAKKAEPVKKTVEKKTTAKKTVAKAAAKTATVKPQFVIQYQNNEVDTAAIEERVKAQFISEGHKASTIKKVNIYIKPEDYSAYYVINDKFSGRVGLF